MGEIKVKKSIYLADQIKQYYITVLLLLLVVGENFNRHFLHNSRFVHQSSIGKTCARENENFLAGGDFFFCKSS